MLVIIALSLVALPGPSHVEVSASTTRITGKVVYQDETVSINGSIVIENGGNLTLINATLLMNPSRNGEYNITIKPGGALWIVSNSALKSNTSYDFIIYMEPGSKLYVKDSVIKSLGYYQYPGIDAEGNITHPAVVEIANSDINITGIKTKSAIINIKSSSIAIHSASGNVLQVGESTGITLDTVNITFPHDKTSTYITIIGGQISEGAQTGSLVEIHNSNITGPFYKFVASGPNSKTLTIIVNSTIIHSTQDNTDRSMLGGNTVLHIINSTISYNSGPRPFIQIHENNEVEIVDSKILKSYIFIKWYKPNAEWGKINLTNTTIDYGIVTDTNYNHVLNTLYIDNVSNSNGQKLILIRGKNTEKNIDGDDDPFQVIVLDSKGPVKIKGVTLNESIQPVIISNSTVELDNVDITVRGREEYPYLPRIIFSINSTNLTIRNSKLSSTGSIYGDAILFRNGGNLTILDSNICVERGEGSFLNVEKRTPGIPLYIKLENTTINISSRKVSFWDFTDDHDAVMIIDNTTWQGYSSSHRRLTIGVPPYGRLVINRSRFTNIEPVPLGPGSPATLISPHDYSWIKIVDSDISLINGPVIEYHQPDGVTVNITRNNITSNFGGDGYIINIGRGSDNGRVYLLDNNITGVPGGASSHIGAVYIDSDGDNETINIARNRIKDCILGIVIGGDVKSSNTLIIRDNVFETMGGIIFTPGGNPVQKIDGNKITGENILYITNESNFIVEEKPDNKISQVIIVNSDNVTIRSLVSGKENIMIQVIDSSNVKIENVTVESESGDYLIRSIMVFNSTNITLGGSAINQTIQYGPYSISGVRDGGIYVVNSTMLIYNTSTRMTRSIRGTTLIYSYYSNLKLEKTNITLDNGISLNNPIAVKTIHSNITVSNVDATLNKPYSVYLQARYSNVTILESNLSDPDGGAGIDADYSGVVLRNSLFTGKFGTAVDAYHGVLNVTSINVSKADRAILASRCDWVEVANSTLRGQVDISDSENVYIVSSLIENDVYGGYGLSLSRVTDVLVRDSSIARLGRSTYFSNVYLSSSKNVTLVNVTLVNGGGNGVKLDSGSDLVIIHSNISLNKGYGVQVSSGSLIGYYLDIKSNGNYSDTDHYDGLYLSSGSLEIHKSNITRNYRLGAYALQEANLSNNYWGSDTGPELVNDAEQADKNDPEEILDPSNDALTGNKVVYEPYLSSHSIRETIPPTGWIESPDNGSAVYGLTSLDVRGKDNEGIASTIIMIDGRIEAVLYGTNQTYKWDTTTVPDGAHSVTLLVVDYSGNIYRTTYVFHVVNVHPYTEIIHPSGNYTCAAGSYPVTVFASDNNPDRLEVYINGTKRSTWFGNNAVGRITYNVHTRDYNDGEILEVKFTLYDQDGFRSTSLVYLRVDNTPPTVTIQYPVNNSYVPGTFSLRVGVSDNVELQEAKVYFNSTLVYQTSSGGTQSVNVSLVDYGYQTGDKLEINLTATDCAGNTGTVIHYAIVDMEPPRQEITSPANNTPVSGTVNLAFNASDNYGVVRVKIYINGTPVYNKSFTGPSSVEDSYEWDTTGYDPGIYEVVIESEDVAHNTNTTTYYYEVLPVPIPEPSYTSVIAAATMALMIPYILKRLINS